MMCRYLVLFAVTLAVAVAGGKGGNWKYGKTGYGTDDWKKIAADCAGSAQSPINIKTSTVSRNSNLKGLSMSFDNIFGKVRGTLTNNGHAPTLTISKQLGTATLTGGPLGKSVYKLEQLHFHFGCENNKGSEHTVDGQAYSGEIHFVTYNTKYASFSQAMDKPDGLSVIGVFMKVSYKDRDDNYNIIKASRFFWKMWSVREPGKEVEVNDLSLINLAPALAHLRKASFYSYKGSLTTPPCYQSVKWIVLKNPVLASNYKMTILRRLRDHEEHSICNNFRPVQALNGRIVSVY
ncbi:carbonic anhydrase 1-like [Acropora muricata]|uniref:carbonic anhydrase 1-like n=1 Tax=Acropora muricata TaxID=159855 RepID=UPI0034E53B77